MMEVLLLPFKVIGNALEWFEIIRFLVWRPLKWIFRKLQALIAARAQLREKIRTLKHFMFRYHCWNLLGTFFAYKAVRCHLQGRFESNKVGRWTVLLTLLFYSLECTLMSTTRYFLDKKNIVSAETVSQHVTSLVNAEPVYNVHVECYHRELRDEVHWVRDDNGVLQAENVQTLHTVVSHIANQQIDGFYVVDASNLELKTQAIQSPVGSRLFFRLHRVYMDNKDTEAKFRARVKAIVDEHRHRDEEIRFTAQWTMPKMKPFKFARLTNATEEDWNSLIEYYQDKQIGWLKSALVYYSRTFFTQQYYWIFSLFGCSFPFRVAFDLMTVPTDVSIVKIVTFTKPDKHVNRQQEMKHLHDIETCFPKEMPSELIQLIMAYSNPNYYLLQDSTEYSDVQYIKW